MASQIQNLLEKTLGDGARSTNFEVFFNMGSDTILNDKNILIKSTALPTRSHQIIDFKYRGKSIPLRGQTKYSQTWECTFYITERHDVRIALEKIMDSLDNMNDYKDNKNNIINTLIIERKDIVNINTEDNPKYTIQIIDEFVELVSGHSLGLWYKEQLIDMLPDDYNIVKETTKDNHGNDILLNKYIQFDIIKYPLIDVFLKELVKIDSFKDLYLFVYN